MMTRYMRFLGTMILRLAPTCSYQQAVADMDQCVKRPPTQGKPISRDQQSPAKA